jgi:hypothetical protein
MPLEVVPPCPVSCDAPGALEKARIDLARLQTPPGDDRLLFRGRVYLPTRVDPPLDPVETGVAVVLEAASGERILDLTLPGGEFDPGVRAGWKVRRKGWTYVDKRPDPPGGIVRVAIRARSRRDPERIDFTVTGRRGAYQVTPAQLPLRGLFVLDPPTAETGQCAAATFVEGPGTCRATRKRVRCRRR